MPAQDRRPPRPERGRRDLLLSRRGAWLWIARRTSLARNSCNCQPDAAATSSGDSSDALAAQLRSRIGLEWRPAREICGSSNSIGDPGSVCPAFTKARYPTRAGPTTGGRDGSAGLEMARSRSSRRPRACSSSMPPGVLRDAVASPRLELLEVPARVGDGDDGNRQGALLHHRIQGGKDLLVGKVAACSEEHECVGLSSVVVCAILEIYAGSVTAGRSVSGAVRSGGVVSLIGSRMR